MAERRTEIRMMCADMVETRWRGRAGKLHKSMGLLEDISPSGACLQFEEAIPVGAEISWDTFRGAVTYCVYREIGYFVGVEFSSETPWSLKEYKPDHLLDPSKLRSS